jgi:hypothetical protein
VTALPSRHSRSGLLRIKLTIVPDRAAITRRSGGRHFLAAALTVAGLTVMKLSTAAWE